MAAMRTKIRGLWAKRQKPESRTYSTPPSRFSQASSWETERPSRGRSITRLASVTKGAYDVNLDTLPLCLVPVNED